MQDLIELLERVHSSYVAEMSDGQNSIIVRSSDDELQVCYALMRRAALALRLQEEELDDGAAEKRLLQRRATKAERACKAVDIAIEIVEERLLEESRLRQEEWREAHVQERIKEYRDRCYAAEEEVARLHKELYER